jgi:hypothetical protein
MSDQKAENDEYSDEKDEKDEKYEDNRLISINHDDDYDENEDLDYKSYPLPQQVLRGMGLDLSLAPSKSEANDGGKGIQENSVLVVFDLPDGSQGESFFKLGENKNPILKQKKF